MLRRVGIYSALHFLNDFISGYLIWNLSVSNTSDVTKGIAVLVFHILGFLGQMVWAKNGMKFVMHNYFTPLALLLLIMGILFKNFWLCALVFIGIASSMIHLKGGIIANLGSKTQMKTGIFAATGILGLALGAWSASFLYDGFLWIIIIIIFLGLWNFQLERGHNSDKRYLSDVIAKDQGETLEKHDLIMVLVMLAVVYRSLVWDLIEYIHHRNFEMILGIAMAGSIGKLIGGIIPKKILGKNYLIISLILSSCLLVFTKKLHGLYFLGISILQSSFPLNVMTIKSFYKKEDMGLAISLSFGGLIFIAGVISAFLTLLI